MAKASSKSNTTNIDRDKLRQAVLSAAEAAGKQFGDNGLVSYLEAQAVATPSPFLTLLSKVISNEQESETTRITHIELVAPDIASATDNKTAIHQKENRKTDK